MNDKNAPTNLNTNILVTNGLLLCVHQHSHWLKICATFHQFIHTLNLDFCICIWICVYCIVVRRRKLIPFTLTKRPACDYPEAHLGQEMKMIIFNDNDLWSYWHIDDHNYWLRLVNWSVAIQVSMVTMFSMIIIWCWGLLLLNRRKMKADHED